MSSMLEDFKLYSLIIKKVKNAELYSKYENILNAINNYVEAAFVKCSDVLIKLANDGAKMETPGYHVQEAIQWLLSDKMNNFPTILASHLYHADKLCPENYEEYCRKIIFNGLNEFDEDELRKKLSHIASHFINDSFYRPCIEA